MKKAASESRSSKLVLEPKENAGSRSTSARSNCSKSSFSNRDRKVGKDASVTDTMDISLLNNSDYIFRNRNNPLNGTNCFFSESTFNLVLGPGPSFEEKIMSQIARIKSEKEEHKQADLNKAKSNKPEPNKSEQKSSATRVKLFKDAEVNKQATVMPLPIDVPLDHNNDAKEKVTSIINNCQNSRPAGTVNCELVSDISTDISKQPTSLNKPKTKKNVSELRLKLPKDVEVSQHTSVLSNECEGQDLIGLSVVTNDDQNKLPSEVINCAIVSDNTAISTSTSLENLTNFIEQKSEKSEQNDSGAVVELFKEAEVDQHISMESLPIYISNDQDLNNSAIVSIVENSSLNNKQPENIGCEPGFEEIPISTSISGNHVSDSLTYLSISKSGGENEDITLIDDQVEVAEKKAEAPFLDGCSTAEDSNTKHCALSPQAINEMCLIMPSLYSDDDDDSFVNDTQYPDSSNRHKHNICEQDLSKTTSAENQPLPEEAGSLTVDKASISSSQMSNCLQENGNLSVNASTLLVHNNYDDLQFQSVIGAANQSIVHIAGGMEMQNYLLCQQSSQANTFDSLYPYNAHWQPPTPAPPVPDKDIPIFSFKETSPEPSKSLKSASINQVEEKAEKLSFKPKNQQMSEKTPEDIATEHVNKTPNFKKSDLTRKEHALYLNLYNKYVRFFTQAGAPPILTEKQCKEISLFEKLQRRVLNEQEEFQNYLQANARKKNLSSFVFMKKTTKNYATCKAQSYRLKTSYAAGFNQTPQSQIPFCTDGPSVDLRFQRSLLEVGIPPRIKLPDVQIGQKPLPLQYDIQKIDKCFPRYSNKTIPGYTHHEPVSFDINVKQLAAKYDFQVVMSSSAVKCLLNNHGPSFDRIWTIPVHVLELESDSKPKRIVYLDKPLFENDLHIRDYNTLFHKYALRSLVSYPKQRHAQAPSNLFHKTPRAEKSTTLDDPFDMFSSNVESLETFGAGHSKSLNLNKEASQVISDKPKNKFNTSPVKHRLEDSTKSSSRDIHGRKLRSNKSSSKKLYKDLDEVTDTSSRPNSDKPCGNSDSFPVKRKRGQGHYNVTDGKLSKSVVNQSLSVTDSESEGEPKKKDITRGYPVTNDGYLLPKSGSVLESADADCGPHKHSYHKSHLLSSATTPPALSTTESENCTKKSSSKQFIHDVPLSLVQDTPLSPVRDTPMSPAGETPLSPVWETPTSPVREILLLPVKNIPLSPLKETSPSSTDTGPQRSSQATARSLSFGRSPDKSLNNSTTLDSSTLMSRPTKRGNETPSFSGVHRQLFTPLDSILPPCFGQAEERNVQNLSKEDPSHYLPPTEVHSSIVYSLWSLHSINVLIRTRCHGVLKDLKKTRRIYISPKMEHQTSYGLEQVTMSEVAKEWTSCFVRPNTNLLRARINAFTSEIMMFEELEPSKILRSSLNFKPEDGFKFLDRVLQQLLSLNCGKYLLAHEYGDNFCGIRNIRNGARSEEPAVPRKRMGNENTFRWIPIDPTILLPCHIANNRIPATFLPKDIEVKNIHSGGVKRNNSNINNGMNNINDGGTNVPWKKYKKGKKKSRKS